MSAAKPALRSETAYWPLHGGSGDAAPPLADSIACEVAVVGAGFMGAFVAHELAHRGLTDVVVVDRGDPGEGGTAADLALLRPELDLPLTVLDARIGMHDAALAWLACARGIDRIEELAASIPRAAFRRRESLLLGSRAAEGRRYIAELQARRGIGLETRWLDAATLRERYRIRRPFALLSPRAAELDPLRFTRGLLAQAHARGVRVHGDVAVQRLVEDASGVTLVAGGGRRIHCRAVVICTGALGHLVPVRPWKVRLRHGLATRPAVDRAGVAARPLIVDVATGLQVRTTRDGRTLLAGADVVGRAPRGAVRKAVRGPASAARISALRDQGRRLLGVLPTVELGWSAAVAESADGMPYVGRVPGWRERAWIALCPGNAAALAPHVATIIADALDGRSHDLAGPFAFDDRRLKP